MMNLFRRFKHKGALLMASLVTSFAFLPFLPPLVHLVSYKISDRNVKEKITPVNTSHVLSQVAALPVSEWSYQGENQRHIGPMAQDFAAIFNLGGKDTRICDIDVHGITFAALQALYQKTEEQQQQIQDLRTLVTAGR